MIPCEPTTLRLCQRDTLELPTCIDSSTFDRRCRKLNLSLTSIYVELKIGSLIICNVMQVDFFFFCLLVTTFRTFGAITSLRIFFDCIYVALGASLLLQFA
jgi:hypothetical protein